MDAPERSLDQRHREVQRISVSLLNDNSSSFERLRERFADVLAKEAVSPLALAEARAEFVFRGQCRTADQCVVTLQTVDGRKIERTVGAEGIAREAGGRTSGGRPE